MTNCQKTSNLHSNGKKEAVSNASTIIFAAKVNRFDLLKNLFKKILVPPEVLVEIFKKDSPENNIIKREIRILIDEVKAEKIADIPVGIGERAAISCCIEKEIPVFLSDDKKARNFAESLNIKSLGILGIILINLKKRFISPEAGKKIFEELINKGFYVSSDIYSEMIKQIEIFGSEKK